MNAESKSSRREQSHERILDAAARAVRVHGYAGVGVADVMKEAGLTHGGFYAHFKSRDELLAAAIAHAGAGSAAAMGRRIAKLRDAGASPVRALVEGYLADEHIAAANLGCPVAALGSEIPRQTDVVGEASRERVTGLLEMVRKTLPDGSSERAYALTSSLIGAVQLARALGDPAQAMLRATRKMLIEQYDRPA
jgi:TetR/AcrR family transcriptional repressor of nem operon